MYPYIKSSDSLVTTREQTRAGFVNFALEKNRRATPIIESAKSLKVLASKAETAKDLLKIKEIRPALLTAAGLSDKALMYFTEADKTKALNELIKNFLEPAGKGFVEEVVYRYLLVRGDSLGGSMRNIVGALAQQKLVRTFLSTLTLMGIRYDWLDNNSKKWFGQPDDITDIEPVVKAIHWMNKRKNRVIAFNLNIPIVKNNIDICLFNANTNSYANGAIVTESSKILMLGELKGGIDPAGADEHWKTGNTALNRIRKSFEKEELPIRTSFIGAAIEKKMATEIFNQLKIGTLSAAANLTVDEQMVNYCNWMIKL